MKKFKLSTGMHEWGDSFPNILRGCLNNCKYCYAKCRSIERKQTKRPEDWEYETPNKTWSLPGTRRTALRELEGIAMYPSTHDIRPENLQLHLDTISDILDQNKVDSILIVSKPHLVCIKALTSAFADFKNQIEFRFTIGSTNNETLRFWETGAPLFEERLECLKFVHGLGFGTSISCEPMLDDRVDLIVNAVLPLVTSSIWIGKMNNLINRLTKNGFYHGETIQKASEILEWQENDDNILSIYNRYKNNPLIRWKDSIIKVLEKEVV